MTVSGLRTPAGLAALCIALVLSLSIRVAPLSAGVQALAEDFAELRLKGPALGPEHASYASDGLELNLAGGSTYPVLAGDRVVGLFHDGGGRFTYRVRDPRAVTNFVHNVRSSTKSEVSGSALSEAFDTALILDASIAERIAGLDQPWDAPEERLQKALDRHRKRFADDYVPCTLTAMKPILENRPAFGSCAQLHGKNDYTYQRDAMRRHDEWLAVLRDFDSGTPLSSRRYPAILNSQPLSGSPLDSVPARWILRHVDLDLTNPGENTMELVVRETLEIREPLKTLDFTLMAERWDGAEMQPLRLDSVRLKDGRSPEFVRHFDNLLMELPEPVAAGATVQLEFRLSGEILSPPAGHSFWWLPIGSWLPRPARLDMAGFTYHAVVKVAPPYKPFSMGKTLRRWQEGGLEAAEFELEKPIQFAVILAGKYNSYEETRDGLRINLSSYAFKRSEPMKRIANNTFELIRFFENFLGPFPFDSLEIIEINSFGFGVAPPGVIYLTREAFDPGPAGRRYRAELNHRMAHEVAHQWWGHVAQMESPEAQWLSESTAEYYGALAIRHLLGEHKFKAAMRTWKEQAGGLRGLGSVYYANNITGQWGSSERYRLLYAKGPLMLHEMHQELGDQKFLTIFKSLLRSFPYQPVNTDKLIRLTNHVTGEDWRPWFEERLFAVDAK